ncbi:hypothetical protein NMG60_11022085 [Bertholletia excelsa]
MAVGLLVIFLLLHSPSVLASDPDPIRDFCIPISDSISTPCKTPSHVTVEDFGFWHKNQGKISQVQVRIHASDSKCVSRAKHAGHVDGTRRLGCRGCECAALSSQSNGGGICVGREDISGFVDSSNRVFAKVIEKGELMVFPKGLVHSSERWRFPCHYCGEF